MAINMNVLWTVQKDYLKNTNIGKKLLKLYRKLPIMNSVVQMYLSATF